MLHIPTVLLSSQEWYYEEWEFLICLKLCIRRGGDYDGDGDGDGDGEF